MLFDWWHYFFVLLLQPTPELAHFLLRAFVLERQIWISLIGYQFGTGLAVSQAVMPFCAVLAAIADDAALDVLGGAAG